jgi:hypothetical protein
MAAEQSAAIFFLSDGLAPPLWFAAAASPGDNRGLGSALVAVRLPVAMDFHLMANPMVMIVGVGRCDGANSDRGERDGKQNFLHGVPWVRPTLLVNGPLS